MPSALDENMAFLLAEIDGQLARLGTYFAKPRSETAYGLAQRAGYSHNLASRVTKACLAELIQRKTNTATRLRAQSLETVARNLDLISRLARRAAGHAEDVEHPRLLRARAYLKPIKQVRAALSRVQDALASRESALALEIGQTRSDLDAFYDQLFRTYTRDMRETRHTEDLASSLLSANEVRRMGEALHAMGEAILSINIGQSVRFDSYFTLRSVLSDVAAKSEDIVLQPLAETRSGSAISSVSSRNRDGTTLNAVFKDGDRRKVKEERVGVKSWNTVYPGLAPEILSYQRRGESAALLIEHVPGQTFEDILLGGSEALLEQAQKALHKTVRDIWQRTMLPEKAQMGAMAQLSRRMGDVGRVHPGFVAGGTQHIAGCASAGFDRLIAQAREREEKLKAPFSVYIHGDFNLDNIIYDPAEKSIRFIDLHRSRYMDYLQDVSVFMVSNYRLQVLDRATRARIAQAALAMHATAAKFARRQKDHSFEYRLALALARSFASSTRFVFDQDHARRMFMRARFLLEAALRVPEGQETRLKLPIRELFHD